MGGQERSMVGTAGDRGGLASRIRLIRVDIAGDGHEGIERLAESLGIPPQTWANYEGGVTIPALVILDLICLTGVSPRWLLDGRGEAYPGRPGMRGQAHGDLPGQVGR
jgi:transcriptional regulator with XRE-family HTH domain